MLAVVLERQPFNRIDDQRTIKTALFLEGRMTVIPIGILPASR